MDRDILLEDLRKAAGVQLLGGLVTSNTQRSSAGPPDGLNTAWLAGKNP
jgi:hypothetical protein